MKEPQQGLHIGGKYKHFKGDMYQVIGIGRHSETEELFVIYKALYTREGRDPNLFNIRPLEMFFETVTRDGKTFPRFEYIREG